MKFIYKPEGAEPREWDFKPERLMNAESEAIERVSEMLYPEWTDAVMRGSTTAVHALLWVFLKRSDPTRTYNSVTFCPADYDIVFDDEEKAEYVAAYDAEVAAGEAVAPEYTAQIEAMRADLPPAPTDDIAVDLDEIEDPESYEPEGPKGQPSRGSIFGDGTSGTSPTTSPPLHLSSTG